jgi:hypothetical protein
MTQFSLLLLLALAGAADYERDIKPLLAEKCGACHGALKQEAGLRLDAGVLIRRGSDGGAVIVPGDALSSLLIRKISASDPGERMPPAEEGEPLGPEQIARLVEWINGGAVVPENEDYTADPRQHWAFQVPSRPALPRMDDPRWSHPIDVFIAGEHGRLGVTPAEPADRYTLLRRLYFDLIGLPPTPQQLQHERFLMDGSAESWQRLVDKLLASPHYGERWGRHWMDVWRYSDWDGYKEQLRGSQRHIWRWRDWIVESLNSGKGYDRMVVEMVAGDEIAPSDPSVLAATGFLARNYHNSNRNIWLDATVEHTGKALLGLTLNCARCHDHKYDPIPQADYYRFRAIFEPHSVRTDPLPSQPDAMKDGLPRAFDAELDAATYVYRQGNEKQPDKDHPMSPGLPAMFGSRYAIHPVELPLEAFYPSLQEFALSDQLAAARERLAAAERALAKAASEADGSAGGPGAETDAAAPTISLERDVAELGLRSLEARIAADRAKYLGGETDAGRVPELARAAAAAERELNARQAELDLRRKQSAVAKAKAAEAKASEAKSSPKKKPALAKAEKDVADAEKTLAAARDARNQQDDKYTSVGKVYSRTSSGRRLALASWIASRDNPLAARVAVNHIWMRHFGEPLVGNVFDFGLRSPAPRHVRLLDWLAVEFMENGWSLKHLHRLIVTSRTWQMASTVEPAVAAQNRAVDPDNHFLWRMNVRRLDAEIIRDSVLAVTGQLDPALGGPDIDFTEGETSRRRSIYLRHAYEKQMTMLVLFDAASPTECYRRSESIIPQQALALVNSSLALGHSRLLSRQLAREIGADGEASRRRFVNSAFLTVLSRPPADEELQDCLQFLDEQIGILSEPSRLTTFPGGTAPRVELAADPRQRALDNLVHVLLNHNDFVTVR